MYEFSHSQGQNRKASWRAGDVDTNSVDACARRDIERFPVGIAEFDIRAELWKKNCAKMLARRRDDPDAAGTGLPEIAIDIDAQAIGDAAGRIAVDVD